MGDLKPRCNAVHGFIDVAGVTETADPGEPLLLLGSTNRSRGCSGTSTFVLPRTNGGFKLLLVPGASLRRCS